MDRIPLAIPLSGAKGARGEAGLGFLGRTWRNGLGGGEDPA